MKKLITALVIAVASMGAFALTAEQTAAEVKSWEINVKAQRDLDVMLERKQVSQSWVARMYGQGHSSVLILMMAQDYNDGFGHCYTPYSLWPESQLRQVVLRVYDDIRARRCIGLAHSDVK